MIWFLLWILCGVLCGTIGKDRECGAFYGAGWGLLCPPIGIIYVALSKRKKTMAEALLEAETLYKNNVLNEKVYEIMKSDILRGKIRSSNYYINMQQNTEEIKIFGK